MYGITTLPITSDGGPATNSNPVKAVNKREVAEFEIGGKRRELEVTFCSELNHFRPARSYSIVSVSVNQLVESPPPLPGETRLRDPLPSSISSVEPRRQTTTKRSDPIRLKLWKLLRESLLVARTNRRVKIALIILLNLIVIYLMEFHLFRLSPID
jgi:hypothetical protein